MNVIGVSSISIATLFVQISDAVLASMTQQRHPDILHKSLHGHPVSKATVSSIKEGIHRRSKKEQPMIQEM